MQKTISLLLGLVVLLCCGMLVLREQCSTFAIRRVQFGQIENGMTEREVVAILGEPTSRTFHSDRLVSLLWNCGNDEHPYGRIVVMMTWAEDGVVESKWIREPLSLWDRVMEALNMGEDERLGQTFSF